jgi:hypothetical protein
LDRLREENGAANYKALNLPPSRSDADNERCGSTAFQEYRGGRAQILASGDDEFGG